jgi:hypothetical protein
MLDLVLWCLMSLLTMFHLYRGGQFSGPAISLFLGWQTVIKGPAISLFLMTDNYQRSCHFTFLVTQLPTVLQVTDKLYHIMLYTSPWSPFELTTSVTIVTMNSEMAGPLIIVCQLNTIKPNQAFILWIFFLMSHKIQRLCHVAMFIYITWHK